MKHMKKLLRILTISTLAHCQISTLIYAQPTLMWAKQMGGITSDYGYSIALDSFENVYTTGLFESPVILPTQNFLEGPVC